MKFMLSAGGSKGRERSINSAFMLSAGGSKGRERSINRGAATIRLLETVVKGVARYEKLAAARLAECPVSAAIFVNASYQRRHG